MTFWVHRQVDEKSWMYRKRALEYLDYVLSELWIGDVFLQGGFPGHGVVVDLAFNPDRNDIIFLIAQSFMPAQEIHILKNWEDIAISPWYKLQSSDKLYTPEWIFEWEDLKRF